MGSQEQKPTLIFSPGAWHPGACFKPTTDVLSGKYGYKCVALNLPSIGSELRNEPPPQNWDVDVSHIRNAVIEELDAGNNVVLVVHSYSGTVGSEACKDLDVRTRNAAGKTTCVRALVYLSAIVLDIGGWVWEMSGGKPVDPNRTVMKGDLCYVSDMVSWFYEECDESAQKALSNQLQSHAWKCFMDCSRVSYTAWRDIPSWYMHNTKDNAVPYDIQKVFVSHEGGKWTTKVCDGDHSPMISRVDETVSIIREAAGHTE